MFLFNVTKRYESNQKKPQNKIQSNLLNFVQVQEPDKLIKDKEILLLPHLI